MAAVDEERAELLGDGNAASLQTQGYCGRTFGNPCLLLVDICFSIPFYWVIFYIPQSRAEERTYEFYFNNGQWAVLVLMVLWRLYRAFAIPKETDEEKDMPYTCGIVKSNNKTMFMVATIHISPRSPDDVDAVIASPNVAADTVMIELDDERLDKMRDVPLDAPKIVKPKQEDLQPIQVTIAGPNKDDSEMLTIYAQRAMWNAERAGETITGIVNFEKDNVHGLESQRNAQGRMCLVQRGGPEGVFAPFAVKAHIAARAGGEAVVIISQDDNLPLNRFGGGTMWGEVKTAFKSGSCGFPAIPGVLITQSDGQQLLKAIEDGATVNAEMKVRPDNYPRRTLARRLCQTFALMFSGIGILYGIISCFAVEVGGEFLQAEIAAKAKGIPCACIDSDINQFWSRLGTALVPTPCNILDALLAWLAFPRILFQALFPPRTNVDVLGSIVLHAKSFSIRTWLAFMLAGYCASFVTSHIMALFTNGAERVAEHTGAVSKENRSAAQVYLQLILQLYMLPRIYEAVAATRDEVMYQSIVSKGRATGSSRMVVVVGAGHANGIMQRARTRGL